MDQVFLFDLNTDISEYVESVSEVVQSVGEVGNLIINDITSLMGINITGFWDYSNPVSPFFELALNTFDLLIYRDGFEIFAGSIQSIQTDESTKTATVNLQSELNVLINQKVIYVSEIMNPAEIVQDILTVYKIRTDNKSFGDASLLYNVDNVKLNVYAPLGTLTILDLIQTILNVGIASMYVYNGIFYYNVVNNIDYKIMYSFSDKVQDGVNLLEHPKNEPVLKDKINGYSIQWIKSPSITHGLESQQSFTFDGSYNSPVRISNIQTAVWIGENMKLYSSKINNIITFAIPANVGRNLQLLFTVELIYKNRDYGKLEIVSLNNNNRDYSIITGRTI